MKIINVLIVVLLFIGCSKSNKKQAYDTTKEVLENLKKAKKIKSNTSNEMLILKVYFSISQEAIYEINEQKLNLSQLDDELSKYSEDTILAICCEASVLSAVEEELFGLIKTTKIKNVRVQAKLE